MSDKNKKNEIYVRKVIGNPIKFFKQKQTIHSAIESSEPNDIIRIGSSSYDIKSNEIVISHNLSIIGGQSPKPSIIFQNMKRNIGMMIQNGKRIEFKNINLLNKEDTIGIYISPLYDGQIIFENITNEKPFLSTYIENQPIIKYEGSGELIIKKSKIKSIVVIAPDAKVTILDSEIGDLTHSSYIYAKDTVISNSKIDQIHFSNENQLYLYDSTINSYIEIENSAFIRNVTLGQLDHNNKKYKIPEEDKPYIYLMPGSKTSIEFINNELIDKTMFYIKNAELWISGYSHLTFNTECISSNGIIYLEDEVELPITKINE